MGERIKPILGAAGASLVANLILVTYVFVPQSGWDLSAGLVPGWLGLAIVSILGVLLLDWVNQSIGNPIRTAMVIAASQILLVDVYYVLNGTREIGAALASVVVLVLGYGITGFVYGKLSE
jgi:hypothetical protein